MVANINPRPPAITDDSYPALSIIAGRVSQAAQKNFLLLVAADLIFLLIGTILSALSVCGATHQSALALALAMGLTFGISLFLTVVLKTKQYEKLWYGTRAIAEAMRTMAWRYMTCAEPY